METDCNYCGKTDLPMRETAEGFQPTAHTTPRGVTCVYGTIIAGESEFPSL